MRWWSWWIRKFLRSLVGVELGVGLFVGAVLDFFLQDPGEWGSLTLLGLVAGLGYEAWKDHAERGFATYFIILFEKRTRTVKCDTLYPRQLSTEELDLAFGHALGVMKNAAQMTALPFHVTRPSLHEVVAYITAPRATLAVSCRAYTSSRIAREPRTLIEIVATRYPQSVALEITASTAVALLFLVFTIVVLPEAAFPLAAALVGVILILRYAYLRRLRSRAIFSAFPVKEIYRIMSQMREAVANVTAVERTPSHTKARNVSRHQLRTMRVFRVRARLRPNFTLKLPRPGFGPAAEPPRPNPRVTASR
jgi:hypothetical protein